MSEIVDHSHSSETSEFPKKGQSGSGRTTGYTVEARYTGQQGHAVVAGAVYTNNWKRINPEQSSIGVPAHHRLEAWLQQTGLMSYPAAQAIRWWFHAIAEQEFQNLCLETRIIKHQVEYSFKEQAVSEHVVVGGEDRSNMIPDWGKRQDNKI